MKIQFNKINTEIFDISDLTQLEVKNLKESYSTEDKDSNYIIVLDPYLDSGFHDEILKQFPRIKNKKTIIPFLSIQNEFKIPEFKNFNVITGLNGSGKTHLLQAINNGSFEVIIDDQPINQNEIAFFDYLSFILKNEEAVDFNFENLKLQTKNHFESSIKEVVNSNLFSVPNQNNLSQVWRSNKNKITSEAINKFNENFKRISLVRKIKGQNNSQQEIRYSYQDIFGHREDAHVITESDIHNAIMSLKNKNDFLTDGFSVLFRSAQITVDKIIHENDIGPSQAEKKYKEEFGFDVPWKFVNDILDSYNNQGFEYKYSFEKPNENLTQPLKARLVDNNNNAIEYQNLSSGEKILLTLSLFILQRSISEKFPKVLLLDEIDATLHPSLCENLIETLKNNLITKGTKLIFATHNPSTIAFCDEIVDGIFVIENSGKIEPQSKEKAISILSSGLVTLSQGNSFLDILLSEPDKELFIFTEGENTTYLKHTSKLFLDKNQINKIKIIDNIKNVSSDSQLKILFDFFTKLNHQKKVLFVWDCDCSKNKSIRNLKTSNNVYPFIFETNLENTIAKEGIENLLPIELFDGFINETQKSKGNIHRVFDKERKRDLENEIIIKDSPEIFKNFSALFEKIKTILK